MSLTVSTLGWGDPFGPSMFASPHPLNPNGELASSARAVIRTWRKGPHAGLCGQHPDLGVGRLKGSK